MNFSLKKGLYTEGSPSSSKFKHQTNKKDKYLSKPPSGLLKLCSTQNLNKPKEGLPRLKNKK
jgi:hypothetical protein